MKVDLHCHSNYSDGSLSPLELFERAKALGIELLAVTDHDTMASYEDCLSASEQTGVLYMPAVEISAYDYIENRHCHIVGLNVHHVSETLQSMMDDVSEQRRAIGLKQIELLQKMDYAIHLEDFDERRRSLGVYKQHIMEVLIVRGYAKAQYDEVYYKLFKGESPLNISIAYPCAQKAVEVLRASGVIPVLAHPTQYMNMGIVERLVESGLLGIEAYYPGATEADRAAVLEMAAKHQLIVCGGSDFHGSYSEVRTHTPVVCLTTGLALSGFNPL